jgi:DNA repair photolyase
MEPNKPKSNMYEFIDKCSNPLAGKCPHECNYCYVEAQKKRFELHNKKYSGEIRLDEKVLKTHPKGEQIFLCSCNDLFAADVPEQMIIEILGWAVRTTLINEVSWLIQTKNPMRILGFSALFLPLCTIGTTIETNRENIIREHSKAPLPTERAWAMGRLKSFNRPTFVTIEPIMDFDVEDFLQLIRNANPDFINIGADSKGHNLPEPSKDKILALIDGIKGMGIEIRKKSNLERLTK